MSYYQSIQKVIDYIEDNLDEKLDSKKLADIAGFSKSHFLLIFQAYTNYSLMSYIRKRRLSMAAKAIKESNDTITDISYSLCFESHDVFSRAFKRTYGITPYQYRTGGYLLSDTKKIELYDTNMEDIMTKTNIVTTSQMHLIGIERRITDGEATPAQVWDLYFSKWDSMFSGITNRVDPDVDYAICLDRDEDGITYFIGFEVSKFNVIPDGAVGRTIPKLKCAKFTAIGEIPASVIKTYDYIYKEWFPKLDFQISSSYVSAMERYDKRSEPSNTDQEMDIFIPIEPALPLSKEVTNIQPFKAAYCKISGDKKDCVKIKKQALTTIIKWAKDNGLYTENALSIYAMNAMEGDKYWYEVFIPVDNASDEMRNSIIQTKNYDGGLCVVQSTLHKMLEPTAKAMEKWCGESTKYKQVYKHWYEEYVVENGKITLDTLIRLHMWIEPKNPEN